MYFDFLLRFSVNHRRAIYKKSKCYLYKKNVFFGSFKKEVHLTVFELNLKIEFYNLLHLNLNNINVLLVE